MAEFESDSFFEGEWDDKGDLAWNEFDWAQYLGRCDKEVARFQKIYQRLTDNPERVDEAAKQMGWDQEDWSANPDESETAEPENFSKPSLDLSSSEEPSELTPEDVDPYSAQKHPVFVVSRALVRDIDALHQGIIRRPEIVVPADLIWDAAKATKDIELNVALAVNMLDLGDFALGICYFKHAFRCLNQLLSTTGRIPEFLPDRLSHPFSEEVTMRLFDLREVWLRVINECREEGRDFGESEEES
ncbi:MAG: hypothetical protein MK080_06635 [Opitutales bacterium]|nr:hypothetical protein [Opitutales bacterium]NRA25724.1 hypothetical protein [Opitutales bacterium]